MTEAFQETRNVFDEKIAHLARKVKEKNGFGDQLDSVSLPLNLPNINLQTNWSVLGSISTILTMHREVTG